MSIVSDASTVVRFHPSLSCTWCNVICCALHVARCPSHAVRPSLHVASCLPHVAGCNAACCLGCCTPLVGSCGAQSIRGQWRLCRAAAPSPSRPRRSSSSRRTSCDETTLCLQHATIRRSTCNMHRHVVQLAIMQRYNPSRPRRTISVASPNEPATPTKRGKHNGASTESACTHERAPGVHPQRPVTMRLAATLSAVSCRQCGAARRGMHGVPARRGEP